MTLRGLRESCRYAAQRIAVDDSCVCCIDHDLVVSLTEALDRLQSPIFLQRLNRADYHGRSEPIDWKLPKRREYMQLEGSPNIVCIILSDCGALNFKPVRGYLFKSLL